MVDPEDILSFPDEVLLNIFEFCDVQSLGRLARTCRRFRYLIYSEESCWRMKSSEVVCSNMFSRQMQHRSKPYLSCRYRCAVAKRWREGLCQRSTVIRYGRCLPWVALDKHYLFCSKERMIIQYPRNHDGNVMFYKTVKLIPHSDDVSQFVINENEIVTVARDGLLGRWTNPNFYPIHVLKAHNSEVNCVDAKGDIIVSGSRDSIVKIWRTTPEDIMLEREIYMDVRVLSVAIMPPHRYYVVGLPGTNNVHPLQLFDFENDRPVTTLGATYRRGAGILDIHPETDFTFLCCGYDTTVKLWDVRSPQRAVASWMDPYDNGMYCVQSDNNFTIVSGASRSGLVHVWDKRKPGENFLHLHSEYKSPAYSVAFDASHLFVAYDRAILQYSYI